MPRVSRPRHQKKVSRPHRTGRNRLVLEPLETRLMLATFSVGGLAQWTDSANNLHQVPLADVELYEHSAGSDVLLGTAQTDLAGHYHFDNITYDDSPDGNPDIFVRLLARSAVGDIKSAPGANTYAIDSAIIDEVPDASTQSLDITAGNVSDNETAFSIHHSLVLIGQYIGNLAGTMPSQINVIYPTTRSTSCFVSSLLELHILSADRWDWDVIDHEYGHYVQNVNGFQNNPGGNHGFGDNLSQTRGSKDVGTRLAWGEGWPTFFALSGQLLMGAAGLGVPNAGDTHYQDTIDSTNDLDAETGPGLGEDNEVSVITTLWDSWDAASDGLDHTSLPDRTMFNAFRDNSVFTVGAAWEALAAGLDTAGKTRLGGVFGQNKIAPELLTPDDNATPGATPETFTWRKNGGGAPNPLNDFRIRFYTSDFSSIIFEKDLGDTDTFTPTAAEWDTIRAGDDVIKWVVEGRNTTGPATPGGALGYYWSSARTLGGVSIVFVIDDTGSMSEEIDSVVEALQMFIDVIDEIVPPGELPPTIQLITFKDDVTVRITSNDMDAVRAAVGSLFASGGGDCPEYSAQALAQAAENVAPGGTILLATDASTQPGVDMAGVIAALRAKNVTVNTILSGDCEGIDSASVDTCEDQGPADVLSPTHSVEHVAAAPTAAALSRVHSSAGTSHGAASKPGDGGDDDEPPGGQIVDPGQAPIDDHGNTYDAATLLAVNGPPAIGAVGNGDANDYFAFQLEAGKQYAVTVENLDLNWIELELFDTDGVTSLDFTYSYDTQSISFNPADAGTYYLRVGEYYYHVSYLVQVEQNALAGVTSAVDLFSAVSAETGGTFLVHDEVNFGSPEAYVAALYNVMVSSVIPAVISADPGSAPQGESVPITLSSRNTNWRQGSTTVAFSDSRLQVQSVTVHSATSLTAFVQIDGGIPTDFYDVTVTTDVGAETETAEGQSVFEVTFATDDPQVLGVFPSTVKLGATTTVSIFGANVAWGPGVTVDLGAGVTVNTVTAISDTELEANVTVDAAAEIGFRTATVTMGGESAFRDRALFVGVADVGIAEITLLDPTSGAQGQDSTIAVQGLNTNFVDGTTTASFGDGVEVLAVHVLSPTEAMVDIHIAADAGVGYRNVSLSTGAETAVLLAGFYVEEGPIGVYNATDAAFIKKTGLTPGKKGAVTLLDGVDDAAASIDLGTRTFTYFGKKFTGADRLFVSTNGLITFGSGNSGHENSDLTASPEQQAIAVAWDDWTTTASTKGANNDCVVYKFDDANHRLIVEWNSVAHVGVSSKQRATFQAILGLDSEGNGDILIQFIDMKLKKSAASNAGSATIGLKFSGDQGPARLLVSQDNPANPMVGDGKNEAIRTFDVGAAGSARALALAKESHEVVRVSASAPIESSNSQAPRSIPQVEHALQPASPARLQTDRPSDILSVAASTTRLRSASGAPSVFASVIQEDLLDVLAKNRIARRKAK